MLAVTVSPKFQVVIPKEVRESMGADLSQRHWANSSACVPKRKVPWLCSCVFANGQDIF